MLQRTAAWFSVGLPGNDWSFLTVDPADAYSNGWYKWSYPMAVLWAYGIAPLGYGLWTALHVAAVATLPRQVAVVVLLTFPFWLDVGSGNVMAFCFVLAWHALDGKRWAVVGFCIAACFMPRPLMLPVLAYLFLRRTDARVAFAWGTAVVVVTGLATAQLDDWLRNLAGAPAHEVSAVWDFGPSRFLGYAWAPIGLVLGVYLTWKGRLGLASLAISPYLIHYYLMFGLLELRGRELGHAEVGGPVGSRATSPSADRAGSRAHPGRDLEGVTGV